MACSGTEPSAPPPLLTTLPRQLSAAEQTVQGASNRFSFELLRRTAAADAASNIFLSPLSVSFALGMALNGATGETYEQIRHVLGFEGMAESEINEAYHGLVTLLLGLDSNVQMEIANSVWQHELFPVRETFLEACSTWFDAAVRVRDFRDPATVAAINDWVSSATQAEIPSIIDQIAAEEILFLINAIYFHGNWRVPFNPSQTTDAPFLASDGGQGIVKMMRREGDSIEFVHEPDVVAVNLPYGNGAFAMALLRPAEGSLSTFTDGLSLERWNSIRGRFRTGRAVLRMPRFSLDYKRSLGEELRSMGMPRAFDRSSAEFDRIADVAPERLFISRVEHRAAVDVDEQGTTAAAATAVGVGVTSAPPQLDFDRPFLFVLYEQISGTVLFVGRVVDLP